MLHCMFMSCALTSDALLHLWGQRSTWGLLGHSPKKKKKKTPAGYVSLLVAQSVLVCFVLLFCFCFVCLFCFLFLILAGLGGQI